MYPINNVAFIPLNTTAILLSQPNFTEILKKCHPPPPTLSGIPRLSFLSDTNMITEAVGSSETSVGKR